MKTIQSTVILVSIILASLFTSCNENKPKEKETQKKETEFTMSENSGMGNDKRVSLKLNAMQKKSSVNEYERPFRSSTKHHYSFIFRQI